jgi:RHS repeat-associated protein
LEQIFNPQGERLGYYSVGNGLWLLGYVPWKGRELAKYAWTDQFNFYHPNSLGSADVSTDQTGTLINDILFQPWGQELANSPSGALTFDTHFAGMHASVQGSSLIDWTMLEAAHRFYTPSLGRWHSPDPIGRAAAKLDDPQTWNMYAYVRNNPTTLTDPYGESWFTDFFQAFANCFHYGSCHTTEHIAEVRTEQFMNSLATGYQRLTPSQKEDMKSRLFGGLSPADQIRAVAFYSQQFEHIREEDLGPPGLPGPPGINYPQAQLEHEFMRGHARNFGVQGNWNSQTGARFQQALENLVNGPNTRAYSIEFRGQAGYTAYVDLPSGNAVIVDPNGNFAASWSLGADQMQGVIVNGKLW